MIRTTDFGSFSDQPNPDAFDHLMEKTGLAESLVTIDRSVEDIKAGRVRPFRAAMHEIACELGLKVDGSSSAMRPSPTSAS